MQPSLYARYIEEREGKFIYENKKGYVVYSFNGEECYIEEIYILLPYRKTGVASTMADHVAELAKSKGCTFLTGTIDPGANNSTVSMKVLISYGFKLHSVKGDLIILTKPLEGSHGKAG